MRIVGILSIVLFMTYCTTIKLETGSKKNTVTSVNDFINLDYLNRFVIEQAILNPVAFDFDPIISTKEPIGMIAIFHIDNRDSISKRKAHNYFLKQRDVLNTIQNKIKIEKKKVFSSFELTHVHIDSFTHHTCLQLVELLGPNFMGFIIDDIYQTKNAYLLPVTIMRKYQEFDICYMASMFFEFERCENELYIFTKCYSGFGFNSEPYPRVHFTTYIINKNLCR